MRAWLTVAMLLVSARALAEPSNVSIRSFDKTKHRLIVTCKGGGETGTQALKRTGGKFVFGGGYFYSPRKRVPVDLVVINGKVICPYLKQKKRPILVIASPPKIVRDGKLKSGEWIFALAGDHHCQEPQRKTRRQVVGITAKKIYFVALTGTEKDCRKLMKGIGISNYIFFDGGSAVGKNVVVPTHIIVV